MGKYEPLRQFLKRQKRDRVPMTFAEIERILGAKLPRSKSSRAFWSNNPDNNVMTREWIAAGFETGDVQPSSGRLVFNRKKKSAKVKQSNWEQVYGCMEGQIWIDPTWDLTRPAFDENDWSKDFSWLRRLTR